MRPIRRILFAIKDPEAHSMPALRKAAQLARALDAQLELFHAMTWPLYAGPYLYGDRGLVDLQQQVEMRVRRRLDALARGLRSRGRQRSLRISVAAVWDLPAYEAVIRRARDVRADLIIAEPHHGWRLLPLLHFNDWELLRRSPVPVLLLKRRGLYKRPVILAAVDPTHREDRAARLDRSILDLSQTLAEALGGRLHSVHAYTPLPRGTRPTDALDFETAATLNRRIATAAQQRYDWLLQRFPLAKQRRHLLAMPPVEAIAQTARETRSAIVALGVVARGGWRRLLMGRTAESLLDRLSVDLLVVKPHNFQVDIAAKPTGAHRIPAPAKP